MLAMCDVGCAVSEERRSISGRRRSEVALERSVVTGIRPAKFRAYLVLGVGLAVGLVDNGESHRFSSSSRSKSSISTVDFVRLDLRIQVNELLPTVTTLWRQKCRPRVVFSEPIKMKNGMQTHAVTIPNCQ